jgi:pimeloyl-ACP methyl ester carboxylesterase
MRAAALWRRVLACEFALAIAVAWSLRNISALPAMTVFPAALAVFLLIQCLLVAASTVAGRALAGAAAEPARALATALATARAIAHETLHFTCIQLAMSLQVGVEASDRSTATHAGHRPVLLVHGLACNRGVWWLLSRRLRAAGFGCVHVIDLEPLNADLDQLAGTLEHEVVRLRRIYPGERLTIVAHSMGGLVARAMLRLPGSGPIHHLITLATPHCGASLARALDWPCIRQMRPGSEWLACLNTHTADSRAAPRTTCIYSANDNLVAPANSAALPGAAHFEVSGLGHFGLLISRRVGNLLIGALREAA